MATIIHDQPQPILFNTELVSVSTASATSSRTLPACGAVRITSGGATLFFSFTASASSSPGTGIMMLPANSEDIFETQGNHTISLKVDDATLPATVGITPMVGEPRAAPGINDPDFFVPFTDAGSGAVNLTMTTGVLGVGFTRATAAAAKLSTGLWKLNVASGVARAHYLGADTAVGGYGGYLAEDAATNACLQSRDLTDVAWTKTTLTTAKTSTGIDGAANSCTRCTAAGANSTALQAVVLASAAKTFGVWLKRITGTGEIDITLDNGSTWTNVTTLINSTTFTLVQATQTLANPTVGIRIVTSTDAVDVDVAQLEDGATALSTPIPTTAAAVTRNADVLVYSFLGNALASAGTIYAEYSALRAPADGSPIVGFASNTTNALQASATATSVAVNDGTTTITATGLTSVLTGLRKRAASYGPAGMSVTGDGVAPTTGAFDGAMASTQIAIGCRGDGTTTVNGTVKNVMIWKRQLTDTLLQSLTT